MTLNLEDLHGKKIEKQTIDQIVDDVMKLEEGTKIQILAPVIRGKKGEYKKLLENNQKEGFVRARIDGNDVELGFETESIFIHPENKSVERIFYEEINQISFIPIKKCGAVSLVDSTHPSSS